MAKLNGFTVWDEEYDAQHFTPEEIAESDLEAELIMALVDTNSTSYSTWQKDSDCTDES